MASRDRKRRTDPRAGRRSTSANRAAMHHRHVLHANAPRCRRGPSSSATFQLLHEESLAADLRERPVEHAVAARGHSDESRRRVPDGARAAPRPPSRSGAGRGGSRAWRCARVRGMAFVMDGRSVLRLWARLLHCGKISGSPSRTCDASRGIECHDRAPSRNPLQLHLVLGSRDRDPAAGRGRVARARGAARAARDRPLGAHALRGAGRHLGGAAQSLPPGRPPRQPAPPRHAGRGDAPSPERDRQAPRATSRRRDRVCGPARRRAHRRRCVRERVRRDAEPAPQGRAPPGRHHAPRQHPVRRHGARLPRDRRDRLARRVSLRRGESRYRG